MEGCGVYFTSDQAHVSKIIEQVCQRILPVNLEVSAALFAYNWEFTIYFQHGINFKLQEEIGTDSIIICVIPKRGTAENPAVYWYSDNKLTPATTDHAELQERDDFLLLRLTAMVPLTFEFSKEKGIMLILYSSVRGQVFT